MADKKIVDLTAIVTQSSTDIMEVSLNGSGSRKESRAQQTDYFNKNLFSPANTIYVSTNGNASNDGSLLSPFAKPSQAISAAVSAGVSNTTPYHIVVFEGTYDESGDLSLLRPGLFTTFMPGVRLTMQGFMSALGWSGVAGATCGVDGFAPIAFAGVNFVLPSDAIAQMYFDNNNWNSASDSIALSGDNASFQSYAVFNNCVFPGGTIADIETEFNNCRGGGLVTVASGGHPNIPIYFNGGTYFTSHEVRGESGGECRGVFTSAFVGAFNCTTGGSGSSSISSVAFSPGQIGGLSLSPEGGHATPTNDCQIEGRYATPDADMRAYNYQYYLDITRTGAGRILTKFADPGLNLYSSSICSPINFRVKQASQQTITNNTLTVLTLDEEAFDVGGYWASNTFTPLMPGKYQFNFVGSYTAPGSALIDASFFFYKNGSLVASATLNIALGKLGTINLSYLDSFNGSTDALQVKTIFTGNGGSDLQIDNADDRTYITGFRVSD